MELREPKRKRKTTISLQSPFPVPIENVTGIPTSSAVWKTYTGTYNGDCVVVKKSDEVSRLFYHGFFGKGSLSRSFPEYGKIIHGIPPLVRQRQWELHSSWAKLENPNCPTANKNGDSCQFTTQTSDTSHLSVSVNNVNSSDGPSDPKKQAGVSESSEGGSVVPSTGSSEKRTSNTENGSIEQLPSHDCVKISDSSHNGIKSTSENVSNQDEENMCLVLPDSDDDDMDVASFVANLKPKLDSDPFPLVEALHLSLEEAFFLSYALGCLKVIDLSGNVLTLTNMWQLFCDSQKDFVQCYVVYHYYRAKNWVVKNGLKFGGDFVLYKQGPPFYHASYVVKVEVVDGKTQEKVVTPGQQALGWTRLMGLHRLAETAAKEVLLCQVMWPADLPEDELRSPRVISKFTVREVLIRRWVTSKEREKELDDL